MDKDLSKPVKIIPEGQYVSALIAVLKKRHASQVIS